MTTTSDLGKQLEDLRLKRDLSLRGLSDKTKRNGCPVSHQELSRIEHGEHSPTIRTLTSILDALFGRLTVEGGRQRVEERDEDTDD